MIAFKNVMPANAQYTQSCLVSPAQTSTAAITKNRIAVLRYQFGDADLLSIPESNPKSLKRRGLKEAEANGDQN